MELGKLMNVLTSNRASAMFTNNYTATKGNDYVATGVGEKFELESKDLGFINEVLETSNPISFYGSKIAADKSLATFEVKYNLYTDAVHDLVEQGTGKPLYMVTNNDIEGAIYGRQYHTWRMPKHKTEGIMGIDLKVGIPDMLAKRSSTYINEYGYQSGATVIAEAMIGTKVASLKDPLSQFVGSQGAQSGAVALFDAITAEALKLTSIRGFVVQLNPDDSTIVSVTPFTTKPGGVDKTTGVMVPGSALKPNQYVSFIKILASDIQIMLKPTMFSKLVLSKMTGDATTETFANGIFSVAVAGGIKVVQDSGFLPAVAGTTATGKPITAVDGTGAVKADIAGYVGTAYNIIHGLEVLKVKTWETETGARIAHTQIRDLREVTKFAKSLGITLTETDL